MPNRKYSVNSSYRYGFNGKENDKDAGEGVQDYGMRIYDSRLGRFFSVDPIASSYPMLTPYQFASNSPISGIDLDGLEYYFAADGAYLGKFGNSPKIYMVDDDDIVNKIKQDVANPQIDKTQNVNYKSQYLGTLRTLQEIINVDKRTTANGGKREESSIVMPMQIYRGETGPMPKYEFDKDGKALDVDAPAVLPNVPLNPIYEETPLRRQYNKLANLLNTAESIIHSHTNVTNAVMNPIIDNTTAYWPLTTAISNVDIATFKTRQSELFIITGRLEGATVSGSKNNIQVSEGTAGATYYKQDGSKKFSINLSTVKKINSKVNDIKQKENAPSQ